MKRLWPVTKHAMPPREYSKRTTSTNRPLTSRGLDKSTSADSGVTIERPRPRPVSSSTYTNKRFERFDYIFGSLLIRNKKKLDVQLLVDQKKSLRIR